MRPTSDPTQMLFDPDWYCLTYPDIAATGLDAWTHWNTVGSREARQPSLYFEPQWYLQHNPDVAASGMDPLTHYACFGELEGRHPSPFFDPIWYRRVYKTPRDHLAIAHFLTHRWSGRYAPSPALYAVGRRANDDGDPFAPIIAQIRASGYPFFADVLCIDATDLFDSNLYLIHGSDVLESNLDPLNHFCMFGWREGRKPNLYFDTTWYLVANPDIADLQVNPLSHYFMEGEAQGRRPIPYFDPAWYRATYHLEHGQNALAHFLAYRLTQRFSPNPFFDVDWYMTHYGHRVGARRDPFAHYLRFGTTSNLNPSPDFDASDYRRQHLGRISRAFPHLMHPQDQNPLVHHLRRTLARTAGSRAGGGLYDEPPAFLPPEGGCGAF